MLATENIVVKRFEPGDVRLYPLADAHIGSAEFMRADFEKYIDKIKEDDKGYIVIAGDMLDTVIRRSVGNPYESVMTPVEQKEYLARILEPVKDKIICATIGNHENRLVKELGTDPLYDVMCNIGKQDLYRPNACYVILELQSRAGDRRRLRSNERPTYTMFVSHGSGNAGTIWGSASKAGNMAMWSDADLIVSGHTHKPIAFPTAKLHIDTQNKTVSIKKQHVITATSWLRYGGYAVGHMMIPSAHCPNVATLHCDSKNITIEQGIV